MVLIDTSSWIEALRAQGAVRMYGSVLKDLLAAGEAAWCEIVVVEFWNGARGDAEKEALHHFGEFVIGLPIDALVWTGAVDLAQRARSSGLTVPAIDLVIAACARRHGVAIEHVDQHLAALSAI